MPNPNVSANIHLHDANPCEMRAEWNTDKSYATIRFGYSTFIFADPGQVEKLYQTLSVLLAEKENLPPEEEEYDPRKFEGLGATIED
jgi:hypothetical protein